MVKRLIGYLAVYRVAMAAVTASMLASALVEMLSPWPLKLVVDHVLGQHPLLGRTLQGSERGVLLVLACSAFVLIAGLRGGLEVVRKRWLIQITQKATMLLRSDLYSQVQRLSLRFHDHARVGDTVTRITTDVEKLQDAFMTGLSVLSADILTVSGVAAIMFWMDWRFALVALFVLPPLFLVFSAFRRRIRAASREVRSGEGAVAALTQEVLASIRLVKAFGQEEREQERFLDRARVQAEATVRAATWEGMFSFWVEVVTAAGVALVLGYGGWRVLQGHLTLGQLLVFMQYLTSLYAPVRRLSRLTSVVQKAAASAERIDELFRAVPEVREPFHARVLKSFQGRIVFDDVGFAYGPGRPALSGVSLEIRPGEVVGLVGPTGAGKSTLVSLIPRFYDPTSGRLLVDGHDVRDLNLRSLRDQISLVLQDTFLFSGSIRDNIAYSRPGASEREVVQVARAARAHDFILDLPDGYDTRVGERGLTLSGGQRQRLAIARALLKDAPILILDEPTSSLDVESEALILEALDRLLRGRTAILISHRQLTAEMAERVVVLADGAVVETGNPEELRKSGRFYRRLYAL